MKSDRSFEVHISALLTLADMSVTELKKQTLNGRVCHQYVCSFTSVVDEIREWMTGREVEGLQVASWVH